MFWATIRLRWASSSRSVLHRHFSSDVQASRPFDKKTLQAGAKQLLKTLQGRDVVFYQAPAGVNRTFFFMYVSAGVQLLFWGNLASLAYVSYSKKSSTDESVALAPRGQRVAIAGGLMTIGVAVATLMCMYPWRYVDKLVLLRGGERVRLLTHARFIQSQKYKEYPIEQLYCKQRVFTGHGATGREPLKGNSTHIFLRSGGERMGYMLDRKGTFMDSRLFDGLWYK